ncbi:MAG: hypothetical protein WHT63_09455, partial [Tepidiforma sp.]
APNKKGRGFTATAPGLSGVRSGGAIRAAGHVPQFQLKLPAAGLGGLATWAVYSQSNSVAALFGLSVTALVYSAGAAFDLRLPRPGGGAKR